MTEADLEAMARDGRNVDVQSLFRKMVTQTVRSRKSSQSSDHKHNSIRGGQFDRTNQSFIDPEQMAKIYNSIAQNKAACD